MINFFKSWLRFWLLIGKKFSIIVFFSFKFSLFTGLFALYFLFHIENNGIAPLALKIISQVVFTIYILKTFLLQYVSHNLYQKFVKVISLLIANIYLTVTITIIRISSWMTMILLFLLITLRESRRHKRE